MNIGWPEGIWFGVAALNLICAALLDGEAKTGKHKLSLTMLNVAAMFGILWWGGFFA